MEDRTLDLVFAEIDSYYEEFKENHLKNTTKGIKACGKRARAALGHLKNLVTEYRKVSVGNEKNKI